MVVIYSYLSGDRRTWSFPRSASTTLEVVAALVDREGDAPGIQLQSGGRILNAEDIVMGDMTVVATLTLNGGKGGFGAMLRAMGMQIEKSSNRESYRFLDGRRLRDVHEEERLIKYISETAEREKEAKERKRKRLEQHTQNKPKHIFEDNTYYQQKERIEKNLYDALEKGKRAENKAGSSGSTSVITHIGTIKRAKIMGFDDLDDSSSDDDSDDEVYNVKLNDKDNASEDYDSESSEGVKSKNEMSKSKSFSGELVEFTRHKRYRPIIIALGLTRPFKPNPM